MPSFRYRSAQQNGSGAIIDAPDRASAIRELLRRGLTPVQVEAVETAGPGAGRGHAAVEPRVPASRAGGFGLARPVMSRSEMASFVRELATALSAGLPLVPALRTIGRQGRPPRQKAMLDTIISGVEHGQSLGDALESWGRPFGELTISLVRAGESAGRLSEVLAQAAELLDRDLKLRRALTAALVYPAILALLISAAVMVLVTVIVPKVLENVGSNLGSLPWPTRVVQGVAGFVGSWWWAIMPALLLAGVGMSRVYGSAAGRLAIDRWLLRVPVLGRLLRDVAVARFTRTLGTLTLAGIPAVAALRVTRATLGNRAMERVIDEVCDQVAAGRTIADPMERSGYFPPMLVQIVNMGERSGRLDQMLGQAAGAFEDRTETSVKLFTTALPPLLVVLMACVVGFVMLAILLPLLDMQDTIGGL